MRKIFAFCLLCSLGLLAGCMAGDEPIGATTQSQPQQGNPLAQFNDIPVPEEAVMDMKQSLLFGGSSDWFGRLVFSAPYSLNNLFDFFSTEMPKFGWKEVTAIRTKTSIMTYKNGPRVATIQIDTDFTSAAVVTFTISPEGKTAR